MGGENSADWGRLPRESQLQPSKQGEAGSPGRACLSWLGQAKKSPPSSFFLLPSAFFCLLLPSSSFCLLLPSASFFLLSSSSFCLLLPSHFFFLLPSSSFCLLLPSVFFFLLPSSSGEGPTPRRAPSAPWSHAQGQRRQVIADGHTASNAPDLFRPPKLSGAGPGQYWGGGPPGKSFGCCRLLCVTQRFSL